MSQQINLYNPAFEFKRELFSANILGAALAVLVLGLVAAALVVQSRVARLDAEAKAGATRVEQAQARLTQAQAEFAPRKPDPALQAQLAEAETHLRALQKVQGMVAKGALGNTQGYAEYFRALARQNVDGLWLTAVNVEGAGADIAVRGRALNPALIPGYIGRLRNEPVMQGKTIGSLAIDRGQAAEAAPGTAAAAATPATPDARPGKPADAPFVDFRFQSAAVESKP